MTPVAMNPDDIFQSVQKGFRVTLGAAGTLAESLQNPQNGQELLERLRTNPNQVAEELAEKGEITEQEARRFVDGLMAQSSGNGSGGTRSTPPAGPSAPPDIQADLEDLTAQIAALRQELADLQKSDEG